MKSPIKYTGLRPILSPSRVRVLHPTTIPMRNKAPINPIIISSSQWKSSWSIRLSIDCGSVQSMRRFNLEIEQYSSVVHTWYIPSSKQLYTGFFSRKTKQLMKKAAEPYANVFITYDIFCSFPNPPISLKHLSTKSGLSSSSDEGSGLASASTKNWHWSSDGDSESLIKLSFISSFSKSIQIIIKSN